MTLLNQFIDDVATRSEEVPHDSQSTDVYFVIGTSATVEGLAVVAEEGVETGTVRSYRVISGAAVKGAQDVLVLLGPGATREHAVRRARSTLKGNPLIGDVQVYNNVMDGAYGDGIERRCDTCFMSRDRRFNLVDCRIVGDKAKLAFDVPVDDMMPREIDGLNVAAYCPFYTDYRAE